jgi:glycosyltransferase involved in cell wall biosynthesis
VKLAYLLNSYPMTSTTFIRGEILALERSGLSVTRYAVRPWTDRLVDAADLAEAEKTHYILAGNAAGLLAAAGGALAAAPARFFRGFAAALRLAKNARGGLIRHAAYFLQAAYLARRAKRDGIDHIHAHFATNATAVAMLSRIMGGPSYSFSVHGPDEFDDAKLLSFPEKVRRAAFVVAISNYCRAQIIRFAGSDFADKVMIVRCGVALDAFAPAPPSLCRSLLCIGRLSAQKGQALLPRVMAKVRARIPEAKIRLIGDGPARAAIEAAIQADRVEGAIELLGWRDNHEVRAAIREARALILATFAEGLPIVIMEGFACGRPVIATAVAGIPELLDESCGWIVPAGDEEALAEAIIAALEADEAQLSRLGREARARVEALHDQEKSAAALRALFEGVVV